MPDRLKPRDNVIHRKFGRARVRSVSDTEAVIFVYGKTRPLRNPRRVFLYDLEKEPRPLPPKRQPLRLVR